MRQYVSLNPFTGNRVELTKVEEDLGDISKKVVEMPFSST